MVGSCFSDEIGEQMQQRYMNVTCNPFGTLYNPLSIVQALTMTEVPELVEHEGLWHAMSHHGSFSRPTKEETFEAVRCSIETMQKALEEATVVIVTFGTAWVYELTSERMNELTNERIVGNCHKLPESCFTRRRLTVEEIVAAWKPILEKYSDKHWLFTVSPIRHIKDGLHENEISKATFVRFHAGLLVADHADEAAGGARDALFAAQRRDLDAVRLGDIQNGHSRFGGNSAGGA